MAQRAARSSHQVGRLIARAIARLDGWWPTRESDGQDPAYRATLLYIYLVKHAVMRDKRKNLVEVFARVRVNLRLFKGKSADKRAVLRSILEYFKGPPRLLVIKS